MNASAGGEAARLERLGRLLRWLEATRALRAPARLGHGSLFEQVLTEARQNASRRSSVTVPAEVDELIRTTAQQYGVDEGLVRAVVQVESGFDWRAVSPAGAKGLMQLMDATARGLGVTDPFDPAQNLDGGVRFLRSLLDRFRSPELALAAYNAGPGAVQRYNGVPPYAETRAYINRVMRAWLA